MDKVMERIGITIIKIHLEDDVAEIIADALTPAKNGQRVSWSACLADCKGIFRDEDIEALQSASLLEWYIAGEKNHHMEVAVKKRALKDRAGVKIYFEKEGQETTALLTFRRNTEEHF